VENSIFPVTFSSRVSSRNLYWKTDANLLPNRTGTPVVFESEIRLAPSTGKRLETSSFSSRLRTEKSTGRNHVFQYWNTQFLPVLGASTGRNQEISQNQRLARKVATSFFGFFFDWKIASFCGFFQSVKCPKVQLEIYWKTVGFPVGKLRSNLTGKTTGKSVDFQSENRLAPSRFSIQNHDWK
jgi:hypothetical protein